MPPHPPPSPAVLAAAADVPPALFLLEPARHYPWKYLDDPSFKTVLVEKLITALVERFGHQRGNAEMAVHLLLDQGKLVRVPGVLQPMEIVTGGGLKGLPGLEPLPGRPPPGLEWLQRPRRRQPPPPAEPPPAPDDSKLVRATAALGSPAPAPPPQEQRAVAPPAPQAGGRQRPVIWWLRDRVYQVDGFDPYQVEEPDDCLLQAFLERPTMDLPTLEARSGLSERTHRALRRLCSPGRYGGGFDAAIRRPGRKGGGGYHADVRPRD